MIRWFEIMLRKLDLQNRLLAGKFDVLQKESYAIEAELIGFQDIPPLLETVEELMDSLETFLGYYIDNKLAGAISYVYENGSLEICRLIVDPVHFRKGIANTLLCRLKKAENPKRIVVSTGKDNHPAINLYKKHGFSFLREIEAAPGFYISQFEKTNVQ
jgi:ribosomal protein S18 acetylase RimI-like enzyme